jgi:hypothetical protein
MNRIPVRRLGGLRGVGILVLPALLIACASQPAGNGGDGAGGGGNGRTGGSGGAKTGGSTGNGGSAGGGSNASGGSGPGGASGGSSGAGGSGPAPDGGGPSDPPVNAACGWSGKYTGPLLGRCDVKSCTTGQCGIAVGQGGFLTLDDFEGTPTATAPIGINWASRDGRTGAWTQYASPAGKLETAVTDTAGGAPGSKQALHYSGAAGTFEATLALPMGSSCYDAAAYDGISFWVKGNPGAGNDKIKFNVHTPVSEPMATGGACTAGCYDHFGKIITLTPGWTKVAIKWTDLARTSCKPPTPAIPDGFEPARQIVAFSFSVTDTTKGYDYWIDDVTFDVAPEARDTFPKIVTKALYDEMFKTAAAPYSYDGLLAAVAKYGSKFGGTFAGEKTPLDRKHEVAAFLAHIAHETGSLMLAEELKPDPSVEPYHGRGALQLTLQANYQSAEQAGFAGIVADPKKVIETADYAFGTAIWFWMTPRSAKGVCHAAILNNDFGQTTNIINGGIECNADPASKQFSRIQLFKQFAAAMGTTTGGVKLACP